MDSRLIQPVSEEELTRRRKAIQEQMKKRGLDLLLLCSHSKFWTGYIRYLTNYMTVMYPEYLILPVEDEMTFVGHYAAGAEHMKSHFIVKDTYGLPANPTRSYATDATHIAQIVKKRKSNSIGIVGFDILSAAFHEQLVKELPDVHIAEASDVVDEVRIIKSDEEVRLIEKSVAITDLAIEKLAKVAKPGIREYEVMVEVDCEIRREYSEEQNYLFGSAPAGKPTPAYHFNLWNKTLQEGDILRVLIEPSGPGGYYTEIARILSFGKPPSEVLRAVEIAFEAQNRAGKLLTPGTPFKKVFEEYSAVLTEAGYPRMTGLYGHGQGLDVVEKPFIDPDEKAIVKAGMNIAIHPTTRGEKATGYVCDNFLVTENGAKRLQKTPQEIIIL